MKDNNQLDNIYLSFVWTL